MLNSRTALKVVLVIGICGLLFSGYLSYGEVFLKGCTLGCTAGDSGKLLGIPVCIYGFVMYLSIVIVTLLGLRGSTKSESKEITRE